MSAKCDRCGRDIPDPRPGHAAGLIFEWRDGTSSTLCESCIHDVGGGANWDHPDGPGNARPIVAAENGGARDGECQSDAPVDAVLAYPPMGTSLRGEFERLCLNIGAALAGEEMDTARMAAIQALERFNEALSRHCHGDYDRGYFTGLRHGREEGGRASRNCDMFATCNEAWRAYNGIQGRERLPGFDFWLFERVGARHDFTARHGGAPQADTREAEGPARDGPEAERAGNAGKHDAAQAVSLGPVQPSRPTDEPRIAVTGARARETATGIGHSGDGGERPATLSDERGGGSAAARD